MYGDHRDLHSFPTRRSSDLLCYKTAAEHRIRNDVRKLAPSCPGGLAYRATGRQLTRSEEHTSELQSLTNLVCRLLLEKKKKKYKKQKTEHTHHFINTTRGTC